MTKSSKSIHDGEPIRAALTLMHFHGAEISKFFCLGFESSRGSSGGDIGAAKPMESVDATL